MLARARSVSTAGASGGAAASPSLRPAARRRGTPTAATKSSAKTTRPRAIQGRKSFQADGDARTSDALMARP